MKEIIPSKIPEKTRKVNRISVEPFAQEIIPKPRAKSFMASMLERFGFKR